VAKEGLELADNELTQARRRVDAGVPSVWSDRRADAPRRARDNQTARSTTTTWRGSTWRSRW